MTGGGHVVIFQNKINMDLEDAWKGRVASDDGLDVLKFLVQVSKNVEDEDPIAVGSAQISQGVSHPL